jgi:enolase
VSSIARVHARRILDSRRNPTVEVDKAGLGANAILGVSLATAKAAAAQAG